MLAGARCSHRAAVARSAAPLAARLARPQSLGRRSTSLRAIDKLTAEQLEAEIGSRDRPMIVDFFATWCGPCVLLAEQLKKVDESMDGKVRIVKVDVDECPDLSTQLQIQGLPTLIFIGMDPEKPALRTEGLLQADQIKDILNNHL